MRDKGYRDYLREFGSCVVEETWTLGSCDPAHVLNNGMRSKGSDASCVPLCRQHHREFDSGKKAFQAKYGINMATQAAVWYAAYLKWKEQQ